ncbi:ATP synthase subunit gamma, mitochondrial-like [Halichondria panicea]|uniref:ATP synthase subunit gamma, mitochondrial-like n=1 Tax=Halichondria panicea TaxID=6063 RepID=UPI00312B3B82
MASAGAVLRGLQSSVRPIWHQYQSTRGMATLKELSIRIKSVTNIEKITKSMKMVSAAKYQMAERQLKPARAYGEGAQALYDKAEVIDEERKPKHLIIAVTSDRGLCGGIHSNVARNIRATLLATQDRSNTMVVCVGDKTRSIIQRFFRENLLLHFTDVGKKPPVFEEAMFVAQNILDSGFEYDSAEIVYNRFKNVISYDTLNKFLIPFDKLAQSEKMLVYDDVDEDVLLCYHEMTLANLIFHTLKEGACSEQSSRMTAMDGASKNAGDMISKLTLTYNRTRQAVITRELIEIISGAAAV